jgi:rhodanese-related sulfurtransferase
LNPSIHVTEMHQLPEPAQLVDVRSGSEFASGHIPGAVNIPMHQIEARLDDLRPGIPIVLICQTGKRARMTAGLLEPCQRQISVLEGGTSAWIQAGLPVVTSVKNRWSLERQVRLGAGLLVLVGAVLAFTIDVNWLFLSAFVGLGLTFAGLTDICPMAEILAKMPWNGRSQCRVPPAESGSSQVGSSQTGSSKCI